MMLLWEDTEGVSKETGIVRAAVLSRLACGLSQESVE